MVFDVAKIKELFPFPEFREHQEDILKDIVASFNNGIDVYMLNAPVGSGKSPIGIDLGRMTDEYVDDDIMFGCYYSTPQKMLQDQLGKDFDEYIDIIKGRGSYPCNELIGNSCADGKCQIDTKFECTKHCEYISARDAAMVGQIACYDKDTKVLTKEGFKHFIDITYEDEIATLSSDCTLEYQKPVNIINYYYKGDMVKIKNSGVDLYVTPDHMMHVASYSKRNNQDAWCSVEAGDLGNGVHMNSSKYSYWKKTYNFAIKKHCVYDNGDKVNEFEIPSKFGNKSVSADIFLKFVGWYVSEGACVWEESSHQYYVYIGQNNIMETDIPYLVEQMGYKYSISNKNKKHNVLLIFDKELSRYLIDNFGTGSKNKQLPNYIMGLDSSSLSILFDYMMKGDGHTRHGVTTDYRRYVTSSEKLAYQVVEIALKIGCISDMKFYEPGIQVDSKRVLFHNGHWNINVSNKNKYKKISSDDIINCNYSGMVGCVEVPNHIIFVERNGKTSWCGNCSNFSYLIVVPPFIFKKRELLIVDEAHSVGDWALNYVSCTVNNNGKNIPVYKTFKMYAEWLNGTAGELIEKLKDANEQMKSADESGELVLGLKERRDSIAMILSKVMNVINDYHDNAEDWVWEIFDKGTRKERIQFKPITAGRFLDNVIWWRGEKILTMSGTLFPELFIEESGLIDSVCEYNEIPSTFPPENRPIYYYPCGKMTMSQREYTIPVLAEHVDTIMNRNLDKKGFVHCGSYKIAEAIHDSIVDDNSVSDVWLQDRSRRDDHLEEWMESKEPSLFLSVNRTEGVDLKAELCGYQIVAKVQFPYLGDAQVKARLNMKKYRCPGCGKITRTVEELVDCTCGGKLILDMDVYTFTCDVCGKKLISGWAKHQEILDKGTCACGGNMNMSVTTIDGQYWYNANAVIDLVQSYGRAIRSKTDKAEYWILDSSFMPLYKRMYRLFPKMFKEVVQVIK